MSDTAVAMLKLVEDINKRRDNLPSYAGTSIDEFDTDENGKGKEKPFIPHSLRGKQPLNSSARVQNDSRCTEVSREVSMLRARAQSLFDKYRQDMAKLYKENAELEIKGRQQILLDFYIELLVIVADASVIVAKHGNVPKPTLTDKEITFSSIRDAVEAFPDDHWQGLPFIASAEAEHKTKFWSALEKKLEFKYESKGGIKSKRDAAPQDKNIITWIAAELEDLVPSLTTTFWAELKNADDDKKIESELKIYFQKKAVISANVRLAEAMEADQGDAFRNAVDARIDAKQRASATKAAANKRKQARKKSSGPAKDQAGVPIKNGAAPSKRSKQQRGRSKPKSKRPYEPNDNDNDNSRGDPRRNRRNDQGRGRDEGPHHYYRESRSYSRERNFARRSRTPPPRSQYQGRGNDFNPRWEAPRNNNRGGDHGGRDGDGNHDNRGARNKGRRGGGGRRN